MTVPEPTVKVVHYWVSCLPEDHPDRDMFTIVVEYRGRGRWAVAWNGAYFDADGGRSRGVRWEDDREPVTREERDSFQQAQRAWLDARRFDEETALRIAREQAPRLAVNGWLTVEKALARDAELDAPANDRDPGQSGTTPEQDGTIRDGADQP